MTNLEDYQILYFDDLVMDVHHNQMCSRETNQDNKQSLHIVVGGEISSSAQTNVNGGISSSGQTNVNVADVVEKVQEEFVKLREVSQKPCIFKIPGIFRAVSSYVKDKAYTPCRVAIGPYHAKNADLKPMQQYKLKFVTKLLSYFSERSRVDKQFFRKIFAQMLLTPDNLIEARKYYAEGGDYNPDCDTCFTKMLLIDATFVVGLLCKCVDCPKNFVLETELTPREEKEILRDMILLENQLPFFILDQAFTILFPNTAHNFRYIAYLGLRQFIPVDRETKLSSYMVTKISSPLRLNTDIKHLLHLIWICFLPSRKTKLTPEPNLDKSRPCSSSNHPFRSVTELHEAGVKFKRMKESNIEQVHFNKKGVLKLPRLTLDEFTETFFRNIVAFELYYLNILTITSYVHFMDHLIDTTNDVKLLEKFDLVENWLESKENATTIFNCISKHTLNYYQFPLHKSVSKDLMEFVNKRGNKWMATLCRDYFGNPWSICSFIAALVLLLLTVVQAITSLRQVNWFIT